jgi:glycosyltransferase involved in cell wall biosynthesis
MNNLKRPGKANMTDKPDKFFYLWHYLEWGGAQVLFFGLMKEAKRFGNVMAIMPAGSNKQLLKFLDNITVPYQFFPAHAEVRPAKNVKRKIQTHLKKIYCEYVLLRYLSGIDFRKSIIHTEFAPWQSMLMLLWLCRKTKVFATVHNSLPPISQWRLALWKIKFRILARSKNFHLFAANNEARNSLTKFVGEKFLETVKVIYANVNREEIEEALNFNANRAELLKQYNLPENKFLVFCVGQFIDRKGRWIFLEAARELLKTNEDIAFVWISNYRPSAEDFEKVQRYELGENFTFLSSEQVGSTHVDLFKLLKFADVFALPSYLEGLPISIIEAMALGVPTISTNINAIPEAIKHLETGILIEPGESDALKSAIQLLKADKSLRENLAKNGREYALEKFDEKAVAKIAVETYFESFE